MSAKIDILDLLKIKVFRNNGCDVTKKNFSRDSNCSVDVVMWPKFANSSIFMGEGIIITIL